VERTFDDHTSNIEKSVQKENSPDVRHLIRLFRFVFSRTKGISIVYMGAFLLLSVLRPVLAYIWNGYIRTLEDIPVQTDVISAAVLLLCYALINFLTELISRYVYLNDDIEQLNLVQANHQQEMLHSVLYKKMADIPPEDFEIPKLNNKIEQVFQFAGGRNEMNSSVMLQGYFVIAKTVSVFSIAGTLYVFHPLLCLMVLIAPLPTIWVNTIGQNMAFRFRKNNTNLLRKANYFEKLMISPAAKELKTFALYDFFYDKWEKSIREYTQKERELIQTRAGFLMLHNLIIQTTIVTGSVAAIVLMTMGKMTLGGLGAVLSLIATLVRDVKELLTGAASFMTKKNEAAQFFDFMELPEREKGGEDCGAIKVLQLDRVKYRYPLTDTYILDEVSVTIKQGEKIALVGENGMGKSTFVKLITGVLSPSAGGLKINGKSAESCQTDSRYDKMGTVMQDVPGYVTFSIGDNVFFGDIHRERNEEKIREALCFCGLEDRDINGILGKDVGGTELSGGEWQKLAIAREAYRDRDFIVLDEPTSNLDPLAEAEIFQKYLELTRDKTVIYVTHRISVASLADRILVFDKGRIVQDGTPKKLAAEGGIYGKLYKEQAKWYDR